MKVSLKSDNRISDILKSESKKILSVYFTAGFPNLDSSLGIIENLTLAGADMIEIGIPFSDPVADGEVIQKSSQKALQNGMSLNILFEQLKDVRRVTTVPLIAMGYLNPIYSFGFERFCEKCHAIGIDGLIIPDLPLIEIERSYGQIMRNYDLKNIMLISPNTPEDRLHRIDDLTTGFIYMVSSASTTGAKSGLSGEQISYFERIRTSEIRNPKLIGFGISDRDTFNTACKYADGAIIGSAFIKHLDRFGDNLESVTSFINSIRP